MMSSAEFKQIMDRLDEVEGKIPGHFWIIVMLLIIMHSIGAC